MGECAVSVSCFSSRSSVPVPIPAITMEVKDAVPQENVPRDKRIILVNDVFARAFRAQPMYYVKVPGRVNIIGEHIDYCGFSVLPIAIEQNILIAATTTSDKHVHIKNQNKKYSEIKVSLRNFKQMKIESDANGKPFWYNYVLCGIKGALEALHYKYGSGLKILVTGDIPPAAGLSSSSALVSASCLAFLHSQGTKISKRDIAALCASSEQLVGTEGGGMDQAIAFLAEKNCAQYISFLPLESSPVTLPENIVFVVAHSLVEANKAATNEFNTRVVECRTAARVMMAVEGIDTGSKIINLNDVKEAQDSTFEEVIQMVHRTLPKDNYTLQEVCSILEIEETSLGKFLLSAHTVGLANFKLRQRALHVYQEASRVEKFRNICLDPTSTDNVIENLGNLMSESHDSLKNLYDCSHDNLDLLVDLSKKFGVHARLTGAGWGGCVVAICREEEVNAYIDYLTNEFYIKLFNIKKEDVPMYLFATAPCDGAVIYQD